MPRAVPKHVTAFGSGAINLVKYRPDCMAHVAAVAVSWTEIERALIELVNGALGTAHMQKEHVVGMSGNWVAKAAMEAAETIRTRIKLIDALIAPLLHETELQSRWVELRDELRKCSQQRNLIVHAFWSYTDELPGELVRMRPGHQERWTIEDYSAVLQRFHALNMAVSGLMHDIGAAKAAGNLPSVPY